MTITKITMTPTATNIRFTVRTPLIVVSSQLLPVGQYGACQRTERRTAVLDRINARLPQTVPLRHRAHQAMTSLLSRSQTRARLSKSRS
jgi:hypothetical protein